jgi:hypothetical protein
MSQYVYICRCRWRGLSVGGARGRAGHPPDACPRCAGTKFTVRSEHHPRITRTCEDCGRDYLCWRESRWCTHCRWRHRGRKPKKYVWTPELDALLRQHYDGRIKGRAAEVAAKLGWPRWVITKQAAALGLCYPADRRDWTKKEESFVSWHAGYRTVNWMSKQLKRSLSSVVLKLKRMKISRRIRKGYTMRDLEACFGIDHHGIEKWVRAGQLQIRKRNTKRPLDIWWVEDAQILAFIQAHPMVFRLDKVDQRWFMDLITNGGLIRQALKADRALERAAS